MKGYGMMFGMMIKKNIPCFWFLVPGFEINTDNQA